MRQRASIARGLGAAAIVAGFAWAWNGRASERAVENELRVSGPQPYKNLTVFLVHGQDQLKGKRYVTLGEALSEKKAIMHETGGVNELAIENRAGKDDIFVESGDIVKGGRQDRVSMLDLIVPPGTTNLPERVPVPVYCVEAGRWSGRGKEAAGYFEASVAAAPSKQLKALARDEMALNLEGQVATNRNAGQQRQAGTGRPWRNMSQVNQSAQAGGQTGVWNEVSNFQRKLEHNVRHDVKGLESPTSLQLTVENKNVQDAVAPYIKALEAIPIESDVVGYAFAINGKLNSIELYGSPALFRALWPRLLRASAMEAVAEADGKDHPAVKPLAVTACLQAAAKGKEEVKNVPPCTQLRVRRGDTVTLYETRHAQHAGSWVHRSYLTK